MTAAVPQLKIEELRVGFPIKLGFAEAVQGVSLEIREGEALGIVGESGSGKSLTALAIMGLIDPPGRIIGGRISLSGLDLLTAPESRMRDIRGKQIAMIFQDPLTSLNPAVAIGRQLTDVIQTHQESSYREAWATAVESLALVGIPSPGSRMRNYPHEFSGGMRQRVLIAMAVACRPKVLIADEPTTAVDVTIQAQLIQLIGRLRDELSLSVMFITHNLDLMAELCDRTVVMYAGRVVEEGPVDEIFAQPVHPYTRLLLQCVPRLTDNPGALKTIEGMPPGLGENVVGCPFAPRCPSVMDKCRAEHPPTFHVGNQRAACWLAETEKRARG